MKKYEDWMRHILMKGHQESMPQQKEKQVQTDMLVFEGKMST